jgi:hypothetical protein
MSTLGCGAGVFLHANQRAEEQLERPRNLALRRPMLRLTERPAEEGTPLRPLVLWAKQKSPPASQAEISDESTAAFPALTSHVFAAHPRLTGR